MSERSNVSKRPGQIGGVTWRTRYSENVWPVFREAETEVLKDFLGELPERVEDEGYSDRF